MIVFISTPDNEISFKTEAEDIDDACEKLGQELGYVSWNAMCRDLNYSGSSFQVAVIQEQHGEYSASSDRANVTRQHDSAVLGAFKHLRRLGQG